MYNGPTLHLLAVFAKEKYVVVSVGVEPTIGSDGFMVDFGSMLGNPGMSRIFVILDPRREGPMNSVLLVSPLVSQSVTRFQEI